MVTASSGSLAFTGPGRVMGWLLVLGAALVALGFALVVLADAPRRLVGALARPCRLHEQAVAVVERHHEKLWHEVLWVPRFGQPGSFRRER